jgi:hypothetical protein
MRRGLGLALAMVLVWVVPARADDQDDYRRNMEKIDGLLDYTKGYLYDVKTDQGDYATSKIDNALDKVKEVQSLAEEARRKEVGTEDKRKADGHYDAAREFPESANALKQMKKAEIAVKAADYPRKCDELNGKLKDFVERIVYEKDHEGERKMGAAPFRRRASHRTEMAFGPRRESLV